MNVRIASDTELIEFNGWTLRVRHSGRPKRLLLMIHGWTGDENSMWVFTRGLPSHYEIVAPRGPYKTDTFGYSWRPPMPDTFGKPTMQMFRDSAEALIRLVDEYQTSMNLDAPQFDAMGFSQGAAMTSLLAMVFPNRVRKAGILAGFVPAEMEEIIAQKPLAGKEIFMAHGTLDETVTIERARQSARLFEEAGARVLFVEDEVGHKLSLKNLRALEDYLKD